eukprot:GHVU01160732.1.p1 GENE.GHVU01160732.1~~GHVU01160732.1.p1  ORF type:complete len:325 (-),score=61.30 GHVU01160732.1:809-1783(-)
MCVYVCSCSCGCVCVCRLAAGEGTLQPTPDPASSSTALAAGSSSHAEASVGSGGSATVAAPAAEPYHRAAQELHPTKGRSDATPSPPSLAPYTPKHNGSVEESGEGGGASAAPREASRHKKEAHEEHHHHEQHQPQHERHKERHAKDNTTRTAPPSAQTAAAASNAKAEARASKEHSPSDKPHKHHQHIRLHVQQPKLSAHHEKENEILKKMTTEQLDYVEKEAAVRRREVARVAQASVDVIRHSDLAANVQTESIERVKQFWEEAKMIVETAEKRKRSYILKAAENDSKKLKEINEELDEEMKKTMAAHIQSLAGRFAGLEVG